MALRIGVDVGGTFTKAVAIDDAGDVVARAVVPTSHAAAAGIAEGAVAAIRAVHDELVAAGRGPVTLVGHSTSLAVNSLLEGDVAKVGLIGLSHAADAADARRRTNVGRVSLAPGRVLVPIYRFLDADGGSLAPRLEAALDELQAAGAEAIAASAAFAVEDPALEQAVLAAAAARGMPACAGHQLSGLLGLEMRTVSAVINAAILPRARLSARVVADGMARAGISAPLLLLRGDGGATDLAGFAEQPVRSLFSGPAASVAGALHHLQLEDAVLLEVGGTSTNVSVVRGGRPRVSYVRVGDRTTALRSLDVWVAGIAGGSLCRINGNKVGEVGPRSAHIAGFDYACFASPAELREAEARLMAPLAGDAPDHLVLDADGRRYGLTVTCAANALGVVEAGSYADAGSREAAASAFATAGCALRRDGEWLARAMLDRAAGSLAESVRAAARESGLDLRRSRLVGVGGGAGALVPAVARRLGMAGEIARDAEVLSSIGAARSLLHAVHEASAREGVAASELSAAAEAAETAVIAAGAAPASVETRTEYDAPRKTIRATASGSLALDARATGAREPDVDEGALAAHAAERLGVSVASVEGFAQTEFYRAFRAPADRHGWHWALVDRNGMLAHRGRARRLLTGRGDEFTATVEREVRAETAQQLAAIAPPVTVVAGRRILDCSPLTGTASIVDVVRTQLSAQPEPLIVAVGDQA